MQLSYAPLTIMLALLAARLRCPHGKRRVMRLGFCLCFAVHLAMPNAKIRGRVDRYSLLVGNFHSLLHAGLARLTEMGFSPAMFFSADRTFTQPRLNSRSTKKH